MDKIKLNAMWIPYMKAYRLYAPGKYNDTIAYVDSLDEVDKNEYEVTLCDFDSMFEERYEEE